MTNRFLFDEPDKRRWQGVRGTKPTKSGRIESPLKWAGSKGADHYINPLQRSVLMAGADRLIDPMMGGANFGLNMPVKEVLAADRDENLVNAMQHIQSGIEVPWHEFTGQGIPDDARARQTFTSGQKAGQQMKPDEFIAKPGIISKPTYFGSQFGQENKGQGGIDLSHYEGPTLRGSATNPEEGSLNYQLDMAKRGELGDDGWKRLAQLWLMTQQSSLNALARHNPQGRYNQSRGASGPYADVWNYRHYQPKMKDWTIEAMPVNEFLRDLEIDPKRDIMTSDPPYEGEPAGYGEKFDHQAWAKQLGVLAADGLPIVAFNNPTMADLYRDQGFQTMLSRRMDTAGTTGKRGVKPEMIATANIPGMDAERWFQHHPDKRFEGTPVEQASWEERFDEAFDPSDWLGKAVCFPDGLDPQTIIRRSIVNDLGMLADVMTKALRPEDKRNWGKPGQPMWWSDVYGGGMPEAVKYPWNKDEQGNFGPARPADQFWGGGNMDIYDFMDLPENKDILDQIIGPRGNRVTTDYPVEGKEIVPWSEYMEMEGIPASHALRSATKAAGGYGEPSKMEGISALDMPAIACETQTCGACVSCYARAFNMANNPAQNRQYRILDNVLTDTGKVASALQESLYDNSRKFARGRGMRSANRFKAAGDFKDEGELSAVTDVWNEQLPHEIAGQSHWAASRQYPAIHNFLQGRNWKKDLFPDNVHFKVSLPGSETKATMPQYEGPHADIIRDIISHPQISTTSYLESGHKGEGIQICPASEPENPSECALVTDPRTGKVGCSSCHSDSDIGYRHHGPTGAQQRLTPQARERMKAKFMWHNDPTYKEKVLGRRVT